MSMVSLIVNFVPIILAIVLHELAHGYAAYRLGDNTAKIYGRLTLNPLKHVDLFGTILLPALLYFSQAGFMFGWAKPVPVNFNNLRRSKRDLIIVASAGIVTNLALAVVSAVLLKFISILPQSTAPGRYRPVSAQHGRFQRGAGNFQRPSRSATGRFQNSVWLDKQTMGAEIHQCRKTGTGCHCVNRFYSSGCRRPFRL